MLDVRMYLPLVDRKWGFQGTGYTGVLNLKILKAVNLWFMSFCVYTLVFQRKDLKINF